MNVTVNERKLSFCFAGSLVLTILAAFLVIAAIVFAVFFLQDTSGEPFWEHVPDVLICAAVFLPGIISAMIVKRGLSVFVYARQFCNIISLAYALPLLPFTRETTDLLPTDYHARTLQRFLRQGYFTDNLVIVPQGDRILLWLNPPGTYYFRMSNAILGHAENNSITFEDLSGLSGFSEKKIRKYMQRLTKGKYLQGVRMSEDGIVMEKEENDEGMEHRN